ncbi:hypothetical protein [Sulfobacillus harzensis]|uniref:Uncharacterized protein n=1 Tax=Sulfobacillus harzensis TaxID=2729629 RepID=A0A7Y0L2T5_9FIRM|nr:hypothetical protein [Sulfobacillus harzensis]NMP22048.1 hypothetical protein [Sulfobacillus harzensis]
MSASVICPPFLAAPSRFFAPQLVSTEPWALARQGLVFQASTGDVDVPVNGGKLFLVLQNPGGSGKLLQVFGVGANQYSIFSDLFAQNNPTFSTPLTPVTIQSTNSAETLSSVAQAYMVTETPPPSTPPDGVLLARNLAAASWVTNNFVPGLWVIPPGTAMAFVIYFYASTSAYDLGAISLIWGEVPIL